MSPGLFPEVLQEARERNLLAVPGVGSVEEAQEAVRQGAVVIKVFPFRFKDAADFEKAIKAPLPKELQDVFGQFVRIVPAGQPADAQATFTAVYNHLKQAVEAEMKGEGMPSDLVKTFAVPALQEMDLILAIRKKIPGVPLIPTGGLTVGDLELVGQDGIIAIGASLKLEDAQAKAAEFSARRQELFIRKSGMEEVELDDKVVVLIFEMGLGKAVQERLGDNAYVVVTSAPVAGRLIELGIEPKQLVAVVGLSAVNTQEAYEQVSSRITRFVRAPSRGQGWQATVAQRFQRSLETRLGYVVEMRMWVNPKDILAGLEELNVSPEEIEEIFEASQRDAAVLKLMK